MVTKEKWVEVMRAAGFTDDDMRRWHAQFEKSAPREHQEFLKFLRIPPEEAQSIRDWSRSRSSPPLRAGTILVSTPRWARFIQG